MYIVEIENNGVKTEIHGLKEKLASGIVAKGINTIDTFSFSLLPSNVGFDLLHEFQTLVTVYNTQKDRYEFYGRVLCANPSMDDGGLIVKDVTCESYLGFLCDSQQEYVAEKNWTVSELLNHIISKHNSQIEEYKRFKIGEVNVTDSNDNLYIGIQRENTWDTLKSKMIERLGGEFRFRVESDGLYLDYLTEIGITSETPIALSRNMKSVTKEHDPTEYVTRLIPLGTSLEDSDGTRLGIETVNGGKAYIDDEEAISLYGIHVGYKEWDEITEPANLLRRAREWIASNNKVLVKYSITALDLSLLGYDIDDFDVYNKHPIQNALLGIDDVSRIIKKNIDVCEEVNSTIEVGDVFKNLSDIQVERYKKLDNVDSVLSDTRSSLNNKLKKTAQEVTDLGVKITSAEVKVEENRVSLISRKTEIDALTDRLAKTEASIEVNSEGYISLNTKVNEHDQRISTAEININAANAAIALKASQTEMDELGKRVSQAEIDIDGLNASILLKADKTVTDALGTRVSNAEVAIDGANAAISLKASKSDVDALGTRVSNAEAELVVQSGAISTKVSKDGVISSINQTAEEIKIQAARINLSGYVTASELSAEIADINLNFANTVSTDTLEANSALIGYMAYQDEYCIWASKTVQTSIPDFLKTTIKDANGNSISVVTGWATAPSSHRSTLHYLSY